MIELGDFIGEGVDKKVYLHPSREDCVIAVYQEGRGPSTPEQLKAIYYLQKIKHILFPKVLPDLRAARFGDKVVLITERIKTDALHQAIARIIAGLGRGSDDEELGSLFRNRARSLEEKEKIQKIMNDLYQAGIFVDSTDINWAHDQDDNLINLDVSSCLQKH